MGRTEQDNIDSLEKSVNAYYQTKHSTFFRFFCCVNEETDTIQFKKHCRLAACYADTNQYDKAITALDKALEESEENVFVDKKAAIASLLRYGLKAANQTCLEKAYQIQLKYAFELTMRQITQAYQGLFQLYIEQAQHDKAIDLYQYWIGTPHFEKLSRRDKCQAFIALGDLHFKKQSWDQAHALYLNAEKVASMHWLLTRASPEHQRLYPRLLMTSAVLDKESKQPYYQKVLSHYQDSLDELPHPLIEFKGESQQYNDNEHLKFAILCLLSNTIFEKDDLPFEFECLSKGEHERNNVEKADSQVTDAVSESVKREEDRPLKEYEKLQKRLKGNWEDYQIGGYKDTIKLILKRLLIPRALSPEQRRRYDIDPPNAALFYGPPGTGKTYIASRIGEHLFDKKHVVLINGPELFSPLVGNSEAKMRGLFDRAKRFPDETFVYIFDEIESLVSKRSTSDSVGATVGNRLTSTLLTVLDGADKLNNIIVIGVTNFKDNLDPALLRSGRMGETVQFEIGLPNFDDRLAILRVHLQPCITKGSIDPDIDFAWLARETEGFTAADIKALKETVLSDVIESLVEFTDDGIIIHDDVAVTQIQVQQATFEAALKSFKHSAPDLEQKVLKGATNIESKPVMRRATSATF